MRMDERRILRELRRIGNDRRGRIDRYDRGRIDPRDPLAMYRGGPRRRGGGLWKLVFNLMLWGMVAGGVYVFITFLTMPSLDALLRETREPAITFIDREGYEIQSRNQIMGDPVAVKTLPKYVWQAILAIEDKRFFHHGAVDARGIARAIMANLGGGRVIAGGSSITQQTAKNIFLTPRRSLHRKVQELMMSVWLENRFTKTQILDLYMNRVSLTRGMRGIDAAARDIFNKPATDLSLAESAQLAAMLKAPTAYSPLKYPDKNIARAKIVLTEMLKQGAITKDQYAASVPQLRAPAVVVKVARNDLRYWTDFVMDEIKSRVGGEITADLRVWTTLDSELQSDAADALRKSSGGYQGAVVALNKDGEIIAMVGGVDYGASQFNRVTAPRQPGSTFKTATYLVALEAGMTPESPVEDSAFGVGDYNPKNYNDKYYGKITLADAFAKSANSVPLKLASEFGLDNVLSMAARLGVGSKLRRDYSTILGASEMTLLDLTTMYSVLWNGGFSMKPYSIVKITDDAGRVLYSRKPSQPIRLLTDDVVANMRRMLGDVVRLGTGRRAGARTIGGKTGTSSENRDAWFVGATDDMTIGVWIGNDDFKPMKDITGGTIPADVFKQIAK